jgi:hypothetical protein
VPEGLSPLNSLLVTIGSAGRALDGGTVEVYFSLDVPPEHAVVAMAGQDSGPCDRGNPRSGAAAVSGTPASVDHWVG